MPPRSRRRRPALPPPRAFVSSPTVSTSRPSRCYGSPPPSRPLSPPPSSRDKDAPKSKEHETPRLILPSTPPEGSTGLISTATACLTGLPPRAEAEPKSGAGPSAVTALSDLPDDMIAKILDCLPQDDPSCLLRAALVCKRWLGILTDPNFLRRSGPFRRTPPMLGFFHEPGWPWLGPDAPRFTATTASAFTLPNAVPDRDKWRAFDCRHGRALFYSLAMPLTFLVWEPMTGERWLVPAPPACNHSLWPNAAVVCAVNGCDHLCCHGGPFSLVLVFIVQEKDRALVVCEYSSKTEKWSDLTSFDDIDNTTYNGRSILIRRTLYVQFLYHYILEYHLDGQSKSLIPIPWGQLENKTGGRNFREINLVAADDGELEIAILCEGSSLLLWSREKGGHGDDAIWVCRRVMDLDKLLPNRQISYMDEHGFPHYEGLLLLDFAEGMNVVFITEEFGDVFTVELDSGRVKKLCKWDDCSVVLPLITFYTPGAAFRRRLPIRQE